MVNYKQQFRDEVELGGLRHMLKPNSTVIFLVGTSVAVGSDTLVDTRDGTNYQVPTGKKSKIVFISQWDSVNIASYIIYSDDEDASTNPVTMWNPNSTSVMDNTILHKGVSAPAGKYINSSVATSALFQFPWIYIIEEDA